MKKSYLLLVVLSAAVVLTGCQSMMRGMGMIPMGGGDDVKFAEELWKVLEKEDLAGATGKPLEVYKGQPPHGAFLEMTSRENVEVNGHKGLVIIKRNYGGPGVSIDTVNANRDKYLKAVTVMYKREAGYDTEDQDWFWAKYKPNGSLHSKSKMMMSIALAGRVAKGKSEGCINCHRSAPGGDFIYAESVKVR